MGNIQEKGGRAGGREGGKKEKAVPWGKGVSRKKQLPEHSVATSPPAQSLTLGPHLSTAAWTLQVRHSISK